MDGRPYMLPLSFLYLSAAETLISHTAERTLDEYNIIRGWVHRSGTKND